MVDRKKRSHDAHGDLRWLVCMFTGAVVLLTALPAGGSDGINSSRRTQFFLKLLFGGFATGLKTGAIRLAGASFQPARPDPKIFSGATPPHDAVGAGAAPKFLRVGARRQIKSIAEAARLAVEGSTIEVDAGEYRGDVAVWAHDGLRLHAVGGRVRLIADGAAAEGKGIWVVRARGMTVKGFDFQGARVPSRNGAGIRLETGSLRVVDCSFTHNEMGLLTNNDPETELEVENSEFAYNQRPDGHDHNLYAGTIKRLSVTGSYFHHAHIGHLLKSRAALNIINYNRFSDEADGSASYELEFPNGGIAHVIGNIVQQGPLTQNPHLVSYGAEGYRWPHNEINLIHNTLVDDLPQAGVYLRVSPGPAKVRVVNNLLIGRAGWDIGAEATFKNNVILKRADIDSSPAGAYHPLPGALAGASAADAGVADDISLVPDRQYRHPRRTVPLRAPPSIPGALQPDPSASR